MEAKQKKAQGSGSAGAGASSHDARSTLLEAKIQGLEAELKKMTDLAARAQADLQNAKQRMAKDGEELRKFVGESLLRKLLPTIDGFERAMLHFPEELKTNDWVKGVRAIEQDFMRIIGEMGLRKIPSLGQSLDSAKHEVLLTGSGMQGIVTEVFEEGYELSGRVLRPAKVKTGDGSSPSSGKSSEKQHHQNADSVQGEAQE